MVSWPDIIAKAASKPVALLCGVTYSDKRERVKAYGQGKHYAPIGRTKGKYTVENPKLTFWKGGAERFRIMLADLAPDRKSYGDVEFEFSLQYIPDGQPPMHVQFLRCVYAGTSATEDENPDPFKEEVELDIMGIIRNGRTLFDSTQGAPL
jgi:hypothetical protein